MPQNSTLWGYTRYQIYHIPIYKAPFTDNYHGWLDKTEDGEKSFEIHIAEEVWDCPSDWEETLIHEFIHVLEFIHGPAALGHKFRGGCTPGARVLGHGLAVMLRELHQNGVED